MPQIFSITTNATRKVGQAKITPPALLQSITFTDPQLAGSLGRAMALSGAAPLVVQGLANTFTELLKTLVDPAQPDLTFLTDVEDLSDNLRTALSGFVGAGMADLYMVKLGYVYRCNGRELVHTGPVFDLAYDGGPLSGTDIVAVEAKGSLRAGATPAQTQTTTQNGYVNQVDLHVGTTVGMQSSGIVHGYAIGTGSGLKRGVPCHMHVEETAWAAASAGPPPPPPPVGGNTTSRQPNGPLAVRNYQAVFRLMGSGGILDAIGFALSGAWPAIARIPTQRLDIVTWRGSDYVRAMQTPAGVPFSSSPTFGLRLDVARGFLNGMTTCIVDRLIPTRFPRELTVRALDGSLGSQPNDGGAEFPDGFAFFGAEPPGSTGQSLAWYPEKGTAGP